MLRQSERNIFLSPWFIFGLCLKVLLSWYFASDYMSRLFTPFVNWFVLSGFKNPWEFFLTVNRSAFPYPPVMLTLMAVPRALFSPLLSSDWQTVTNLHLLVMRLPLLAFDVLLLFLLTRLLPTKQKKLLTIYWLSPIVIYINYIHGQLDIIPTAVFFGAILLTLNRNFTAAAVVAAIAAASKTHIFIAMPFMLVFLYRQRIGIRRILFNAAVFAATYAVLVLPAALTSDAFRFMVFNSPEQEKLFSFSIRVSDTLSFIVCPMVVVLVFFKFISYKKLNRQIFIMFLGFVFAALVIFVPPMPGWFMWSLPFLIYFYVSNDDYSRAPFVFYNVIYSVYFIVFFENPHPVRILNLPPDLINNLALSVTMACVGYIALWMFRLGIERNEQLKLREEPFLIGIGGDSASGKHTVFKVLRELVGKDQSIPIFGDNFHKWERGNENWNVYTHLHPSGNRLHEEMEAAIALKDGKSIEIGEYNHSTGRFNETRLMESNKFVFFVGLHPFYLKKMRDLIPMKIFMDTDESLRRHWKIQRDMAKRGYDKKTVMSQIEARHADGEKYIKPQAQFADLTISMKPVEPITDTTPPDAEIPFEIHYTMVNSIPLERLLHELQKIPSIKAECIHDVDTQTLRVNGEISAREIMQIAFNLGLNYDELLIKTNKWLKNYNGVTQLVFLILYNDRMGTKS